MGKSIFIDGDPSQRLPGTTVLAAFLNRIFNHRHDGRDQDGSSTLDYGVDAGAVNALVVAMPVPFDAQIVGLPFQVEVGTANTGATTLALDTFAAAPIHKLGGLALGAGDLQAGQIVQLAWDGAVYQLLSYNSPPVTDALTLQGQSAAMLCPPGLKGEFFMPTAPPGWLLADGRAVLRAQYPALFAAIGTTWGSGDTVSTFNLPDARAEFFRGWDNGRGVDAGRDFGSWQADAFKSHSHGTEDGVIGQVDPHVGSGFNVLQPGSIQTGATGDSETRPRNLAVLVCIKY